MEFSEKLKYWRNKKGLTQEEVAKEINVTTRTYQNYEGARAFPQQSKVYIALSQLFQISVDYLLFDDITSPNGKKGERTSLSSQLKFYFENPDISQEEKDTMFKKVESLYKKSKE
ncbi:MAG: helix-turn-helix transcriptional regulator [Tissierellia bacterium]|nr:helix-turn-helix transcriptional regulator [Tissierellia bacterium]